MVNIFVIIDIRPRKGYSEIAISGITLASLGDFPLEVDDFLFVMSLTKDGNIDFASIFIAMHMQNMPRFK